MNPKLSNSPSAARVLEMATRVSRVAGASATLVAHMLGNVERMVTDLVADSTEVARESEVLYTMAAQHAASVQAAIRATPRFTRVVSEVLRVVAAYRLHQAKASLVPSPRADSQLQQLHVDERLQVPTYPFDTGRFAQQYLGHVGKEVMQLPQSNGLALGAGQLEGRQLRVESGGLAFLGERCCRRRAVVLGGDIRAAGADQTGDSECGGEVLSCQTVDQCDSLSSDASIQ